MTSGPSRRLRTAPAEGRPSGCRSGCRASLPALAHHACDKAWNRRQQFCSPSGPGAFTGFGSCTIPGTRFIGWSGQKPGSPRGIRKAITHDMKLRSALTTAEEAGLLGSWRPDASRRPTRQKASVARLRTAPRPPTSRFTILCPPVTIILGYAPAGTKGGQRHDLSDLPPD